ncbi:Cyclin-L1 [Blattella germanica]|nr:Cyclin-L1 [Blattella germanica]
MILDQNYIALKTQVIKAERRVLKELGFCVHVKHPHKIIVMYLQVLGFEKHQNLMQLAWNYMNDSLRTDVFVRYQPETVACACIYLTSRKLNISLPKSPAWFSIFRVSEEDIQDVCFRILRLYKRPKPNSEELDRRVEELRRHYQEARLRARGGVGGGASGAGAQSGNNTPGGGSNSPNSPSTHSRSRHSSPTRSSKDKHHNSVSPRWGGFISRNNHTSDKHRSRSRSRTVSHSPPPKHSKKSKKRTKSISRSRSRSRSYERKSKKSHKRRSYSRSPTPSPHKSRKILRDKGRYRSRSRSHDGRRGTARSRSQSYDRYEKYYSSDKLSSKSRSKHDDRIRSKDRR